MRARPVLAATAAVSLFLSIPAVSTAQLISIKTVPVAEGDQFGFFPTANLGMGGVSIAIDDTLLDPFGNPAKASRLGRTHFFGSPSFYSVSSRAGGGRTLPLGGFAQRGATFGGFVLALQEVDAAERNPFFGPQVDVLAAPARNSVELPVTPKARTNQYALAMAGRTIPNQRLSIAASAFWSGLSAVDGVDLLYAGSQAIRQFGQSLDFRLGLTKELGDERSLAAVLVHNRFSMTHDVTYVDFFWDPTLRQTIPTPRVEHNPDRTNTWGLHLQYRRPISDSTRFGAIVTANRMSHPKIPNYEIMAIPRDPGYSSAFNIGAGVASVSGQTTIGLDVVLEPIWSHTWADAATDTPKNGGGVIPAGGKTIENRFRFANATLRTGVSHDFPLDLSDNRVRLQLGVELRSINYHLDQYSHVVDQGRQMDEGWIEWTYTGGTSVRLANLDIHYRLRTTSGTGRPGVAGGGTEFAMTAAADGGRNFIVAPSGEITLAPVRVTSHQFSVSVPLR